MKPTPFLYVVLIGLGGAIGLLWHNGHGHKSDPPSLFTAPEAVHAFAPARRTPLHSPSASISHEVNHDSASTPPLSQYGSEERIPARLWGTIKTESGNVVSGQKLRLYSPALNQQHIATSNDYGEFTIDGITASPDYRLTVAPRGMFYRYESKIAIQGHAAVANVVLRKLPLGLLVGRVVDIAGEPVPGLELVVKSVSRPRWNSVVTSDHNGQFELENVPQGKLEILSRAHHLLESTGIRFDTASGQLMRITGVDFVAGGGAVVDVIVDAGPHSIMGRVQDEFGEPLKGVDILVDWAHSHGLLRSVSMRRTMTDYNGEFLIKGLGSGKHELIISSSGIGATRRSINVGYDSGLINAVLVVNGDT